MQKSAEAFRSIGEVAKMLGIAPHVLRYWETQFPLLKPVKRPDGRRYYRPDDVRLVAGLCELLRDEGLTIRGAKKLLSKDRGQSVRERGALRLGEAMAETPDDDRAQTAQADAPIERVSVGLISAPPADDADDTDDISDTDISDADHSAQSEADSMSNSGPRSRQRKRRPASNDALPLFPDLDSVPKDAQWLPRLVSLSARLRRVSPQDAGWRRGRRTAAILNDAIARLY